MPDLTTGAVRDWLATEYPAAASSEWPPPIRAIEERDGHPGLLAEFGHALDDAASGGRNPVSGELDPLRSVLAQLGAARLLRLLQWALEADLPEAHALTSRLLQGSGSEARALRAALRALALHRTLDRMFSPQRVAALETACAIAQNEST